MGAQRDDDDRRDWIGDVRTAVLIVLMVIAVFLLVKSCAADEPRPIVIDTIGDPVNDPVVVPIESGRFIKAGGCEPDGGDCWPLVMSDFGVVQSDPVTIRAQLDRIEAMLCAFGRDRPFAVMPEFERCGAR